MAASMPIAIVGMSCRFPGGAECPETFWDLLRNGSSSWSPIPEERFNAKAFHNPDPSIRGTFNCEGAHFLNSDVRKFDAQFFGINPKEAAAMDPQQRLQLECAYEAMESGGMRIGDLAGSSTSVFVSIFNRDYDRMLFRDPDNIPMYHMVGNGEAILSNRISHIFDLKGPSVTLDTGCSGGLVALHLACQSIRTGESKQAIVGGTNLILAPDIMASLSQIRFFSPQGRCYSHDERAAGYGRGEGAAALLIKPLRDALQDGDPIRAVIRTTAVNQDGRTQGITLPSKDAQIALIRSAYNNAGLDFSKTAYCEAHGTGTAVGDPIEAEAIATVLGGMRTSHEPIYVGSVKTNIGHLESASGLAGLIKTVLMLERGKIVPNHDFQKLNPKIRASGWNLKIPSSLLEWPVNGVRQASVNSFGYGGTNCHAVLDNSHASPDHRYSSRSALSFHGNGDVTSTPDRRMNGVANGLDGTCTTADTSVVARHLFVVSGMSAQVCVAQKVALKQYLEERGNQGLAADFLPTLSSTLCSRRSLFPWRWAISATTLTELKASLNQGSSLPQRIRPQPKIGFVFTGQGSQWHAMGRELVLHSAVFTASLRRGDKSLKRLGASWSLIDELFKDATESRVTWANIGQPVVTALQLALVDLFVSWDIKPFSVVGHSSGEIAAAYAAGMLSYESAMAIAYWRGEYASHVRSNRSQTQGSMMAVPLSESDAKEHISQNPAWKEKVVIACSNSPSSVTLSGDSTAVVEIQKHFDKHEISARLLKVDTAYHSHHMQKISGKYLSAIKNISPIAASSQTLFFSSVTATRLSWNDLQPSYWIQNLVSKVRFYEALQEMCGSCKSASSEGKGLDILLEVGPHATLATPIKQTLQNSDLADSEIVYLPSLKRNEDAVLSIHRLASQLWSLGAPLDLRLLRAPGLPARPKPLTDLPRYQWDRSMEHWSEPRMSKEYRNRPHPRHELLGSRSIDFDPILPKWRNKLRLSEVPWLRDHIIESQIIYPAAGFLSMAIEAVRQTVIDRFGPGMVLHSISFRDVTIERALILNDDSDGVEVVTTLETLEDNVKHTSTSQYAFRVRSFDQQEQWADHCRGSVMVNFSPQQRTQTKVTAKEILPDREANYHKQIEKEAIYEKFLQKNIQYRGSFATVSRISAKSEPATAFVDPPSFVSNHSNGSVASAFVHPTVLDGCFQVLLALTLRSKNVRRPPLLNFIRELNIRNVSLVSTDHQLQLQAQIYSAGSSASNGKFEAWSNEDPVEQSSLISGTGIQIVATSGLENDTSTRRPHIYRNEFISDVELLEPFQLKDICGAEVSEPRKFPEEELEAFETLSLYFVQRASHIIGSVSFIAEKVEHLRHLWKWMETFIEQNAKSKHLNHASWGEAEVMQLVKKVQGFGDEGKMLVRMGYSLPAILKGTAQPLPLMLENDLLSSFYQNDSLGRCYIQMGKYLQLLSLKTPRMAILEIGAGTGSTTVPVLEALSRPRDEYGFMFESYDFTDISSGFFDKAQTLLKRWKGSLNYKRLNIEKRPSTQDFKSGSYDLVIASNVLHATCDIENTIRNVRELLKPGGKFVLLEITKLQAHLNVSFGGLPGWWAGVPDGRVSSPLMTQALWRQTLRRNCFSDFDVCLSDYDGEARRTEVLVSTAEELKTSSANPGLTVCIDKSNDKALWVAQGLKNKFDALELVDVEDIWTGRSALGGKICLFLGDITGRLLTSWPYSKIKELLRIMSSAARTLCVVQKGAKSVVSQADGLFTGSTRSWNLQNSSSDISTLYLSAVSAIDQHLAAIWTILQKFLKPSISPFETEYFENEGHVTISRLLIAELATDRIVHNLEAKSLRATTFQQGNHPLMIEDLRSRLETKIIFASGSNASEPIGKGEIEILPQYISVAAKNDNHALEKGEHSVDVVRECSGTVRRISTSGECPFKVGDRVCAVGSGSACNQFRVSADMTYLIPPEWSFEEAVSIPLNLVTSLHCLKQITKAQEGESILIYQAAQSLGQAVISLAQFMKLDVYAVVDEASEQTLLTERYGVSLTHIFRRSEADFSDMMWTTDNHGKFNIIVGCSNKNHLQDALRSIDYFGTIVCFGSIPMTTNLSRSEQLKTHCTVSVVDADVLYHLKRSSFQRLYAEVMELVYKGAVKIPSLMPVLSLSADSKSQKFSGCSNAGRYILKTNCTTKVKEQNGVPQTTYPTHDASYIVVSDGSGVGDTVCKWLRTKQAGHISLLLHNNSSNAKVPNCQNPSSEMDIPSNVSMCDLTSFEEITDAIQEIKRKGHPIGGVFHTDFAVMDQTESEEAQQDMTTSVFQKSMPNKSLEHFLDALKDEELDFFAVVSSAWGLTGPANVEQAVNSAHRSNLIASSYGRNYPVFAVDVASLASSGHNSVPKSSTTGTRSNEDQGLHFEQGLYAVLDCAFDVKPRKGSMTDMFVALYSEGTTNNQWPMSPDPRFIHVGSQKSTSQSTQKEELQSLEQELQSCHGLESSTALLCTVLAKRLGKLLACSPEEFKPSSSISEFGIDSLVAAELRAWIFQKLGSSIKIEELLGRGSVTEIARKIAQRSSLIRKKDLEEIPGTSPKEVQEEQSQAPNGIGEHRNEISMELSANGKRHTLYYQLSLPKMPVPSLQTTLEKYALSIRPLLTDAEHMASQKRIDHFGRKGEMGEVLQERLEARSKDPTIKNWLYEYWVTHYYLNPRKPIAPATNFFMAHEKTTIKHSIAKRAAIIIKAVIDFKNDWDRATLEPAMLHDAPICMESYHWLFNSCRIPGLGGDQSRKAQTSNHVTVAFRNSFFQLEAEQHGRTLDVWELESLVSHILKENNGRASEPGFGVLTTEDRDLWARTRTEIKELHVENAASIDSIESSALVICLDEELPRTGEERAHQFWHGNGSNRYSDKPLQFIVTPGNSGFNGEHSRLDGSPTIRLNKHVNKSLLEFGDDNESSPRPTNISSSSSNGLALPTKLHIHLSKELLATIDQAQTRFDRAVAAYQLETLPYDGFGETFLRKMGCHPSTTVQMVFQLASYRFYGKPIPTFEPVGNFRFQQGRYDAVRSLSVETAAFCASMTKKNKNDGPDEQLKRLRAAMNAHIKRVRDLSFGSSIDNHMFGLWMSLREDEEAPDIFTDPIYRYSTDWFFSTSYMPADEMEYGFGPDVNDGWSVQYPIWPNRIIFCITTKTHRAKEMRDQIRRAADDIKALLLLQQRIVEGTESHLA